MCGYIAEYQQGYFSSLGAAIPSQTVSLGQARFGPEIAYRYRMANGTVAEPSVLFEGVWNFAQDAGSLSVEDLAFDIGLRGRVETGIMLYTPSGTSFGAAVSYDGIGSGDYQAVGGKVRVRVPFN